MDNTTRNKKTKDNGWRERRFEYKYCLHLNYEKKGKNCVENKLSNSDVT